jgi:hypothetical protein
MQNLLVIAAILNYRYTIKFVTLATIQRKVLVVNLSSGFCQTTVRIPAKLVQRLLAYLQRPTLLVNFYVAIHQTVMKINRQLLTKAGSSP